MSRQWIRALSLTVEGNSGKIDLSSLRVRFSITRNVLQTTNFAAVRVYNLADTTANLIREKAVVTLAAGYGGNFGLLFHGELVQPRKGRETATDTFLDLFCAEGDSAYNWAFVNKTLAAGATPKDIFNVCFEAMKEKGVTDAWLPSDFGGGMRYPRAVTLFGAAKDYLRTLAQSNNCQWSIQNGQLQMVPVDGHITGGSVVLNSKTGMIGMPTETPGGIYVRCLINPNITVNSTVQIDEKSIIRAQQDLSLTEGAQLTNAALRDLGTSDGTYKVLNIETNGDTHAQPWYMDLTCLGATTGITHRPELAPPQG
jgi:hypothetical protein